MKNNGTSNSEILLELEACIIKNVCDNLKSKGKDHVYLFDYTLDSYTNNNSPSFLNEFAEIVNFFDVRSQKKVLSAMIAAKQSLEKLLVLFNTIESEGARDFLKDEIEKVSSDEFLKTVHWLPEIETGLIEAMNSNVFSELAGKLLNYYENQIIAKDKMYVKDKLSLIFRLKLFVAYRNQNIKEVESIEIPKDLGNEVSHVELYNQKHFFKALTLQELLEYSEALLLFENLIKSEPNNYEYALRLLILKCDIVLESLSKNNSNNIPETQKILKELNEIEQEIIELKKEKPSFHINPNLINYIKAFCYVHLRMSVDFDNLYFNSLTSVEQLNEGFLGFAIERYINDNLINEAYSIYSKAQGFHKLSGRKEPEFLQKALNKIRNSGIEPDVSELFKILLTQPYDVRIKAVPNVVNRFKYLGDFLLYEISESANDLLEKVDTIQKLISAKEELKTIGEFELQKNFSENQITDLLEVIFKGRINYLKLPLQIQPRKGIGGNGTGMGMPDAAIPIGLKQIIFEAVRVYATDNESDTKKRIVEHITKTFNYSTSKYAFYNIVYYEKTDFNKGWEFFKNSIIDSCDFKDEYSLAEEFIDLSSEIGNGAIKTGVTKHKSGLLFYHIYLNFRYIIN